MSLWNISEIQVSRKNIYGWAPGCWILLEHVGIQEWQLYIDFTISVLNIIPSILLKTFTGSIFHSWQYFIWPKWLPTQQALDRIHVFHYFHLKISIIACIYSSKSVKYLFERKKNYMWNNDSSHLCGSMLKGKKTLWFSTWTIAQSYQLLKRKTHSTTTTYFIIYA